MDEALLRAWWSHRQGLDGSLKGRPPAEVLERTGWARSVGGVGPYLTLFARAGTSREAVDAAVAKQEIHELPSARGCTYVLPAADYALGLRVGQAFSGGDMKTALKLGVTEKEIDKLCDAVVKSLAKAPLDPREIREATGGAARSLGPEGVKKGLSTTLPIALGRLQAAGEVRRVPVDGRLDNERYKYARWKPNPLAKFKLSPEEAYTELARRYFRWTGPATVAEFQWFSALGVKAAKAAVEPLKLVALEKDSDRLMFAEDCEALGKFKLPKTAQYALVSSVDAIVLLRRDAAGLVDPKDRARATLSGGLKDLESHAILDRGRIVGQWEFDPVSESIAWAAFGARDKAMAAAVAQTERYVKEQLGDARSFSLDSPKSRVPRIQALRKAAG